MAYHRIKGNHSPQSRGVEPLTITLITLIKEFREAKKVKIIRNATPRGSCLFRGIGESRD